jgi:hypothetical protein
MKDIVYSFYPSWIIMLAILGTSFAAAEVILNGVFISVLQYSLGDQVQENMLGGECDTYG